MTSPDGPATGDLEALLLDVAALVRESLGDLVRHAGTRRCAVLLEADHDELRVVVTDDGPESGQDGRGDRWADLRERALRRGGGMTTEQRDEGGLHVRWSVPLT